MIPPKMDAENWKEYIYHVGDNYVKAIQASGVKKVVNLSSIGAHIDKDGGLLSLYNHVQQEFNKLTDVDVVHLRPGSFYNNFFGNIGMIKHMGIIGNNYETNCWRWCTRTILRWLPSRSYHSLDSKGKAFATS